MIPKTKFYINRFDYIHLTQQFILKSNIGAHIAGRKSKLFVEPFTPPIEKDVIGIVTAFLYVKDVCNIEI